MDGIIEGNEEKRREQMKRYLMSGQRRKEGRMRRLKDGKEGGKRLKVKRMQKK